MHYGEVCVTGRGGRQSATEGETGRGQKWRGEDGWVAGAAEAAEAKQKVPGISFGPRGRLGKKSLISRLLAAGHSGFVL